MVADPRYTQYSNLYSQWSIGLILAPTAVIISGIGSKLAAFSCRSSIVGDGLYSVTEHNGLRPVGMRCSRPREVHLTVFSFVMTIFHPSIFGLLLHTTYRLTHYFSTLQCRQCYELEPSKHVKDNRHTIGGWGGFIGVARCGASLCGEPRSLVN